MDKIIEGFFIESIDNLFFDVKGLIHPSDKIIAFIRYFLDDQGDREKEGKRYSKVYSLSERAKFLQNNFPEYLSFDEVLNTEIQAVPIKNIKKVYDPILKTKELMFKEKKLDFVERLSMKFVKFLIDETKLKIDDIGITGSVLIELHTPKSDIDLVIYGTEKGKKAYEALERTFEDKSSFIRPYDDKGLQKLYKFRSKDTLIEFEDFIRIERNKKLQGTINGKDFYLRLVKDKKEVKYSYGDIVFKPMGFVAITAVIEDDSESIFTPCKYRIRSSKVVEGVDIKQSKIEEIVSFRGRFCEIAKSEEKIFATGKAELVIDLTENRNFYRLLVGTRKEDVIITR